ESGKWLAIWVIARRVAAPLIPLLLGAAAMALLLDSGTVHLPPIRAGAGSSPAPAEKVVVSPPAVHRTHHRAVAPANTAAPTSPATGTPTAGVNTSPTQAGAPPQQAATGGKPASQPTPPATGKTAAPPAPIAEPPAPPAVAGELPKPPKLSKPAKTPHVLKTPKEPEQRQHPEHPEHP